MHHIFNDRFGPLRIIGTTAVLAVLTLGQGCGMEQAVESVERAAIQTRDAAIEAKGAAERAVQAAGAIDRTSVQVATIISEAAGQVRKASEGVSSASTATQQAAGGATELVRQTKGLMEEVASLLQPHAIVRGLQESMNALDNASEGVGEAADVAGLLLRAAERQDQMAGGTVKNLNDTLASAKAAFEVAANEETFKSRVRTIGDLLYGEDSSLAKNTHQIHASNQVIEQNTSAVEESSLAINESTDATRNLLGSGIALGIAAVMLYSLQYLSQWSWAVITDARKRRECGKSDSGDPEFVISCYLLASCLVCAIGSSLFFYRLRGVANFAESILLFAGPILSIALLALALVAALNNNWRSKLVCRMEHESRLVVALCAAVVALCLFGAASLLSRHNDEWQHMADALLIGLFSIFQIGTFVVVLRDDLPSLERKN